MFTLPILQRATLLWMWKKDKECFMATHYNVCVPRKYTDSNGTEKTHFWPVGKMFPMRERDGYKLQLYTKMLLVPDGEIVIFAAEQRQQTSQRPPGAASDDGVDDDIPF
jgi:hypothetical protein